MDDEIHAMVRDADGNVYVGGFENGILHVANDWPVGNAIGVVEKRSKMGQLLWRHVFEIPLSTTIVEAIEIDAARNRLIVVGRTSGSFPGYENSGQFDLFIALLQIENGLQIAFTQDGQIYPEHPAGTAVLPSGDIVVAGYTDAFIQGSAVLGMPTMFIARYERHSASSPLLSLKWRWQPNQPMPLSPTSYAYSAVSAGMNNEDVIVSIKSLIPVANGGGNRIARIDENGGMIWNKLVSPASLDIAIALAATSSGRVFVAGTTGIALAGPALGNSDGFLMERDSATGNLIWGRQFGSTGADWVWSITSDVGGHILVGGTSDGAVVAGSQPSINSAYVLKYSEQGAIVSGQQLALPSTAFVDSLSIVAGCDGTAIVAGDFKGDYPELPEIGQVDSVIIPIALRGLTNGIFAHGFE